MSGQRISGGLSRTQSLPDLRKAQGKETARTGEMAGRSVQRGDLASRASPPHVEAAVGEDVHARRARSGGDVDAWRDAAHSADAKAYEHEFDALSYPQLADRVKMLFSNEGVGEEGQISNPSAQPDMIDAIAYAGHDLATEPSTARLLARMESGKATPTDKAILSARLQIARENMTVATGRVQRAMEATLAKPPTKDALAERACLMAVGDQLAQRHMKVADLLCRYEGDLPEVDAVSRSDRLEYNRTQALGAREAVRGFAADAPNDATKSRLEQAGAVLDKHVGFLSTSARAAERSDAPLHESLADAYIVAEGAKGLRSADKTARKAHMTALQNHWRTLRGTGTRGNPNPRLDPSKAWLPTSSPRLSQREIMDAFISFSMEGVDGGEQALPSPKQRKLVYRQATARAMSQDVERAMPINRKLGLPDKAASFTSRIVPAGWGLAASDGAHEYPPAGFVASGDRFQVRHAPNLALTRFASTGEAGKTLYEGLRHGVLDPYDITADSLRAKPRGEALALLEDAGWRHGNASAGMDPRHAAIFRETSPEVFLDALRSGSISSKDAAPVLNVLRDIGARKMALETASVALSAQPGLIEMATAAGPGVVNLNLSSLSLLTPTPLPRSGTSDEVKMLARQTSALKALENGGRPITLTVMHKGQPKEIQARVHVRTFNFGVNAGALRPALQRLPGASRLSGWNMSTAMNQPEMTKLLGPANADAVGGDAARKIDDLDTRATRLANAATTAESDPTRASDAEALRRQSGVLREQADSMRQLADQCRTIWKDASYRRGGSEPFKLPARLALLTHAMGETPMTNCKSGKDRTGYFDAHVKYLAARWQSEGHQYPPPNEAITDKVAQGRASFALNTGNLEMQAYNTGVPGYKVSLNSSWSIGASLVPGTRGRFRGAGARVGS